MALTVTPVDKSVFGRFKVVIADVTFDASYASGGEALAASDLGLGAILFLQIEDSGDGNVVQYDRAAGTLKVLNSGTTDAVLNEAGADDLQTKVVRILAYGI